MIYTNFVQIHNSKTYQKGYTKHAQTFLGRFQQIAKKPSFLSLSYTHKWTVPWENLFLCIFKSKGAAAR